MGSLKMFSMKTNKELNEAKPYAKEVYLNLYPKTKLPKVGKYRHEVRSVKAGKFLHITYHTIPCSQGWATFVILLAYWLYVYDRPTKIITLLTATLYSFIESVFTYFERGKNYTSFGQFFANLLYIPILLDVYSSFELSPFMYVLLFPFNVWFLEIFSENFIIRPIYGRNVAWNYLDYADEGLEGCVRLGHAPAWWAMGVGVYFVYPIFRELIYSL